jgi:D-3-phosphoglycerate dehydrogenase
MDLLRFGKVYSCDRTISKFMKIAVVEPLQLPKEVVVDKFRSLKGCDIVVYDTKPANEQEVLERCRGVEIVVLVNTPLHAGILEKLDGLKMVAISFTGYDHVDINKCRELGVIVSNVPEYSTHSVAELVFGMVIAAMRRLIDCDRAIRSGKGNEGLIGRELFGKTIGVIGTGKIGQRVCELALAFGMEVLAYSKTKKEELIKKGVQYVQLEELLSKSDIVSIHVPLNRKTERMIGEKELGLLKDRTILVNVARGRIIDTEALVRELEKGRIFACLDVFDMEPPLPDDYRIAKARNTILTPHIGYYTQEALERRLDITIDNIRSFIEGNPKNVVT